MTSLEKKNVNYDIKLSKYQIEKILFLKGYVNFSRATLYTPYRDTVHESWRRAAFSAR